MMARKHLSEAQRAEIRTLYFTAGLSKPKIAILTSYSIGQVKRAIKEPIPKLRSGRPPIITQEQQGELIEFITSSKKNRRMSFLELSTKLFDGAFGEYAIRSTLRRLGYRRYVAYRKPPISDKNRQLRLQFAYEHVNWTQDQWADILWSDETWITGGRHRKTYITRKKGEELDPDCVIDAYRKKHGWMFWGCFSGYGKGPGIFWEKDWGSINGESYRQHTIPIVHGWIQLEALSGRSLTLMQDGAPGHASSETQADLRDRGIKTISWPPYSPDLNPIENCWNWMKDYIGEHYGNDSNPSYDILRLQVKEAWEELPDEFWREQLDSMQQRMKDVILANGMHTKW